MGQASYTGGVATDGAPIPHEKSAVAVRLGRRLLALRRACGLSQERLAELAQLHRTYYSAIERGERNPALKNLHALALALDIPLRELFPLEDPTDEGGP